MTIHWRVIPFNDGDSRRLPGTPEGGRAQHPKPSSSPAAFEDGRYQRMNGTGCVLASSFGVCGVAPRIWWGQGMGGLF